MPSMSEKVTRWVHMGLFTITGLASIVTVAISGSLVGQYNNNGYPPVHTNAYKDRIRILLVASVWMTAFCLILGIGFQFLGRSRAFGILTHLVPVVIGFILYIIGAASLTALTDKIDCGKSRDDFDHCKIVKGLVIIGWISTIFTFATMIFVIVIAFIARAWGGVHRSTLYVD